MSIVAACFISRDRASVFFVVVVVVAISNTLSLSISIIKRMIWNDLSFFIARLICNNIGVLHVVDLYPHHKNEMEVGSGGSPSPPPTPLPPPVV